MLQELNIPATIKGLNAAAVALSREKNGSNEQTGLPQRKWWGLLFATIKEPMQLLLIIVTCIYFSIGQPGEGYFMLAAILIVSGISFYQDRRSRQALEMLKKMNEPLSKVIRDGLLQEIATHDLVVGDFMVVEEGNVINADGRIIYSNDFSINESALTGEAYSVFKSAQEEDKQVYSGTLVVSGLAICEVEQTGNNTKLGRLGKSLQNIQEEPSPLQLQIRQFVKGMAIIGAVVFLFVWLFNYLQSGSLTDSLLKGLTLAMSILPEEIPVAFATFMAMGSWRLMQLGIIVKDIRTVETLGSATVICTDKTGTITENRMSLQAVYALADDTLYEQENWNNTIPAGVITYAMWSSEPVPFDPMEKTLHNIYATITPADERSRYHIIHEYPLEGKPPMMTHIFENKDGDRIIAAKGAPEAIIAVSSLSAAAQEQVHRQINALAQKGNRVLGVAISQFQGNSFPEHQQQLPFLFLGLVAFYDPPKANISSVFQQFYNAGIRIKIITGDNAATTRAIAKEAGLKNADAAINGEDLLRMNKADLQHAAKRNAIFTRMFPEAKLAVITALKDTNEVVAMIGDGVNDGPALKAAHIGIAMGKRGTEIAKQAAALILVNDDLSAMQDAIAMGRRIYTNLKKAIQYIVSIHIPIILTVSLPLFLGWTYPNIFSPVHVIFLELIMGPTCSIIYENEPMERNAMQKPPRHLNTTFLSWKEMGLSIVQGIVITAGVLSVYRYCTWQHYAETHTRSMVFCTLVFANIFLTLANRSFYYSLPDSLKIANRLLLFILCTTIVLLALILYISPIAAFFQVIPLHFSELGICVGTAVLSVAWLEIWKWRKRAHAPQ